MGTINDMLRKMEGFSDELNNLTNSPIPILADKKGMIDRQCPKESCNAHFKVNQDDWKNIVNDDECFCPFCRNNTLAKDYLPVEQRIKLVKNVRESIMANWHNGISMVEGVLPLQAADEFEIDIQCEKCTTRFFSDWGSLFLSGMRF